MPCSIIDYLYRKSLFDNTLHSSVRSWLTSALLAVVLFLEQEMRPPLASVHF